MPIVAKRHVFLILSLAVRKNFRFLSLGQLRVVGKFLIQKINIFVMLLFTKSFVFRKLLITVRNNGARFLIFRHFFQTCPEFLIFRFLLSVMSLSFGFLPLMKSLVFGPLGPGCRG